MKLFSTIKTKLVIASPIKTVAVSKPFLINCYNYEHQSWAVETVSILEKYIPSLSKLMISR